MQVLLHMQELELLRTPIYQAAERLKARFALQPDIRKECRDPQIRRKKCTENDDRPMPSNFI